MNRTYLLRAAHDSYKVVNLNECRDGVDYLCEGGILNILLLESLNPKDKISLFYTLSYIWMLYGAKYPKGTPEMEDDDYTLYSKVVGELKQAVPDMMEMLKNTYEAWLFNEVIEFGGHIFGANIQHAMDNSYYVWREKFEDLKTPPNRRYLLEGAAGLLRLEGNVSSGVGGVKMFVNYLPYGVRRLVVGRDDVQIMETEYVTAVYYAKKKRAKMPLKWFSKGMSSVHIKSENLGLYEQFYGEVSLRTILNWTAPVRELHNLSDEVTEKVTLGVIDFYKKFITRAFSDWQKNIGNISALLNRAHNTGTMVAYIGSKYVVTHSMIDETFLEKMSNLHKYVPEGDDHKTLRFIYNNWRKLV